MGMPEWRYRQWFWALQDPRQPGHEAVKLALRKFQLFCFVLFDPNDDRSLERTLATHWAALDSYSGPELLFFAPVDPPAPWHESRQVKERLLTRGNFSLDNLGNQFAMEEEFGAVRTANPSQTAFELASLLDVPPSIGSCIVLSRRLDRSGGLVLSTNARVIAGQLERLGALASAIARAALPDSDIDLQVSRIAADSGCSLHRTDSNCGIAKALTIVCAAKAACDPRITRNGLVHSEAAPDLETTCRQEHARIARAETDDERVQALLHLGVTAGLQVEVVQSDSCLEICFGNLSSCEIESERLDPFLDDIDAKTRNFLRQGDAFFRSFLDGEFEEIGGLDFRVAGLFWGLALEHELSDVLGHDVRAGLGVDLPTFKWRHQRGLKNTSIGVDGNGHSIQFNLADKRSVEESTALWLAPSLGQLRLGWEAWQSRINATPSAEFIQRWMKCTRVRNQVAHPHGTLKEDAAAEFRKDVVWILGEMQKIAQAPNQKV